MIDNFSLEIERFLDQDGLIVQEIPSNREEKDYNNSGFSMFSITTTEGYNIFQNGVLKFTLINEYCRTYSSRWSYSCDGTPFGGNNYYCVVNGTPIDISQRTYEKAQHYKYIQQRKNLEKQKQEALSALNIVFENLQKYHL